LTDQFGLGQSAHGLDPAEGLLDAFAHLQAALVALVPVPSLLLEKPRGYSRTGIRGI
jgi:hypothetical protein